MILFLSYFPNCKLDILILMGLQTFLFILFLFILHLKNTLVCFKKNFITIVNRSNRTTRKFWLNLKNYKFLSVVRICRIHFFSNYIFYSSKKTNLYFKKFLNWVEQCLKFDIICLGILQQIIWGLIIWIKFYIWNPTRFLFCNIYFCFVYLVGIISLVGYKKKYSFSQIIVFRALFGPIRLTIWSFFLLSLYNDFRIFKVKIFLFLIIIFFMTCIIIILNYNNLILLFILILHIFRRLILISLFYTITKLWIFILIPIFLIWIYLIYK